MGQIHDHYKYLYCTIHNHMCINSSSEYINTSNDYQYWYLIWIAINILPKLLKVWWQLPLFLFILSLSYIHNHIHTVHSFISIRRGLSPFLHCLFYSEVKKSLGCPDVMWTRACHTAGQCTTNWATLHPDYWSLDCDLTKVPK